MAPKTRKKLKIVWILAIILIPLVGSNQELEDYDDYDYSETVTPHIRGNTNFPNIRDVSEI